MNKYLTDVLDKSNKFLETISLGNSDKYLEIPIKDSPDWFDRYPYITLAVCGKVTFKDIQENRDMYKYVIDTVFNALITELAVHMSFKDSKLFKAGKNFIVEEWINNSTLDRYISVVLPVVELPLNDNVLFKDLNKFEFIKKPGEKIIDIT